MPITTGYIGKRLLSGAPGAGVEGDAILNDPAHPIPFDALGITAGEGIQISQTGQFSIYVALRALSGRLTTAGSTNFGYSRDDNTGHLTGGAAVINLNDSNITVYVEEIQFIPGTNTLELGLNISRAQRADFANEGFTVLDQSGSEQTFKFSDARATDASFNSGGGTKYAWTATNLWTANQTNIGWSITVPVTVLNYVPHATNQETGDYLQAIAGHPGWGAIKQSHLPDGLVSRVAQIYAHLGAGYGQHSLGFMLYDKQAAGDLTAAFPVADYEAPALAYVESADGSQWDVGVLREDETTSSVATNRNRVLVTTHLTGTAGYYDLEYAGRVTGDDNYHDVVAGITLQSEVDEGDDGNGKTRFIIGINTAESADAFNTAQIHVQVTGESTRLSLNRITAADEVFRDGDDAEIPTYGVILQSGNNANTILWYNRAQAILNAVRANSDQMELRFFTAATGPQVLNVKPTHILTPDGKVWESLKPPNVASWALNSNTDPIPRGKIRNATGTTFLADGPGAGVAVTSSGGDHRSAFTLFNPSTVDPNASTTFDLDDADKQRGILEAEIEITLVNPSSNLIGIDDVTEDRNLTAEDSSFHNVSILREAGNTYSASDPDAGTQFATFSINIRTGSPGSYSQSHLGDVHLLLADNANNELGYSVDYEGANSGYNFSIQTRIVASFRHEDTTQQTATAPAPRAETLGMSFTGSYTHTGSPVDTDHPWELDATATVISGPAFITISASGTGNDYFTLPAGFYAIDMHCRYTDSATGPGADGGGARIHPEMFFERSTDGGTTWNEQVESRQGGYKKRSPQSSDTINFTSCTHLLAATNERFRIRFNRKSSGDSTTTINETLTGQVIVTKFS